MEVAPGHALALQLQGKMDKQEKGDSKVASIIHTGQNG
jgi:hypothetical protein